MRDRVLIIVSVAALVGGLGLLLYGLSVGQDGTLAGIGLRIAIPAGIGLVYLQRRVV